MKEAMGSQGISGPERKDFRTIKEMHEDERPRERLMAYGPGVLTDAELLAIIIGTGTRSRTAIDLSRNVLEVFDRDLTAFYTADVLELVRDPRLGGIGAGKACKIKAAIELGRRVGNKHLVRPSGNNPEAVIMYLMDKMRWYDQEHFKVLLMDSKLKIFGEEDITIGTATASLVHPREVFSPAVRQRAVSLLVAHNHPSGDPQPSPEDMETTKRLKASGELLGIQLLDHLIIGDGEYFSFQGMGLL